MTPTRQIGGLALGTAGFRDHRLDDSLAVLDAWLAGGGRLIDTARNYGQGQAERAVGTWLRTRGTRDEVLLLTKGAHPDESDWSSRVTPEIIHTDLTDSLDRLGVPAVDIYLVHRDRPSVPVGEILDALAAEVAAGRARSFGVSNWTIERLDAANAWAAANGRPPIAWSSSSLSLAKRVGEPWPGTVDADDEASRTWYANHPTRLEAWSPTANGYFAQEAVLDDPRFDAYRTADNEARRSRAAEYASARGLTATQVALAWVVSQPFAPVAVIGTRSVSHLAEAMAAVSLRLTDAERAWLDHGEPGPSPLPTAAGRKHDAARWP